MHHKLELRVIRQIATIVLPPNRAFAATIALISPLYSWSIFPARASLCNISDVCRRIWVGLILDCDA
jgi:hypothetical protein